MGYQIRRLCEECNGIFCLYRFPFVTLQKRPSIGKGNLQLSGQLQSDITHPGNNIRSSFYQSKLFGWHILFEIFGKLSNCDDWRSAKTTPVLVAHKDLRTFTGNCWGKWLMGNRPENRLKTNTWRAMINVHIAHTHTANSQTLCESIKVEKRNSDMNYGFSEQINAMCVVSELCYFFILLANLHWSHRQTYAR